VFFLVYKSLENFFVLAQGGRFGVVVTALATSTKLSCTSILVSTGIGDLWLVCHPSRLFIQAILSLIVRPWAGAMSTGYETATSAFFNSGSVTRTAGLLYASLIWSNLAGSKVKGMSFLATDFAVYA